MSKLLILNYHDVLPNEGSQPNNLFQLHLSVFLRQLDLIQQANIPIITLSEWKKSTKNEALSIALTFDDGYRSHYQTVFPALEERSIRATFFPVLGWMEQEGFMNWAQLQELRNSQHEIGAHGYQHKKLAWLSNHELHKEIVDTKIQFQERLGGPIHHFAFPFGVYTQRIVKSIKDAQYQKVLTTQSILNEDPTEFVLHRFNVKNTMDTNDFLQLLNGNVAALRKRRNRSSLSLAYNRFLCLGNLVYNKKSNL